jgi:hypothetical protein
MLRTLLIAIIGLSFVACMKSSQKPQSNSLTQQLRKKAEELVKILKTL